MSQFPPPFYLTFLAIGYFMWRGLSARNQAWGLPAAAVLATVGVWYVGDALYNDYVEYSSIIGPEFLTLAWWQLLLFVMVFGLLVKPAHRWINGKICRKRSFAVHAYQTNVLSRNSIQKVIDQFTWGIAIAWLILMGIALVRVEGDVLGLFAPYLSGEKASPWARGRMGGGIDGLLSLAGYIQVLLTSVCGVIFALSRHPRTRTIAGSIFLLSAPFFIFDRTRNTMLAALLPPVLAWILLRLKANSAVKAIILAIAFLGVNYWFSFVIANRGDTGIVQAFTEGSGRSGKEAKHEGLNMLEELGWMNSFLATGTLEPNWGRRYVAELANPIPRAIWEGKPTIGIDYAIARGMGWNQASDSGGGIAASISTGMIGQGVANFGRFFGPVAAACLMTLWVALLARQDLLGWKDPARLMLYGIGLVLTFNMGRDITLLVLYPFFFGLLFLWLWKYYQRTFMGVETSLRIVRSKPAGRRRRSQKGIRSKNGNSGQGIGTDSTNGSMKVSP